MSKIRIAFMAVCFFSLNICFASSTTSGEHSMELATFIRNLFIPADDGFTKFDWMTFTENAASVNWITEGIVKAPPHYEKLGFSYYRQGEVVFLVDGKPTHEVLGKTPQAGLWMVEAVGPRAFIGLVSVSMLNNSQAYNTDILQIFNENGFSVTPYRCDKFSTPSGLGNAVYLIERKGVKPLWLHNQLSCGSAGCAAYFTFIYAKEDADQVECY
jgi:hypothetical protein